MPHEKIERRIVHVDVAPVVITRSESDERGLVGYGAIVGVPVDIGFFTEEIVPGAFDNADMTDVRALFNHDPNLVLGRTRAGTLHLSVDERGLRYEIPRLPRARADVLEYVERGDVDGSSFAFEVADDEWTRREGKEHRRIIRVAKVWDTGPVTYPAYPDTGVAIRSLEQWRGQQAPEMRTVPRDVSSELAPRDEPWEAPTLGDFTDDSWDDLSDAEKRRIAGHFAWAATWPPERYGDLKLPHHRPRDGKVVWRGVVAAAQRLGQADIPDDDLPAVRAHLARHYEQFGETAPWERSGELEIYRRRFRLLGLDV